MGEDINLQQILTLLSQGSGALQGLLGNTPQSSGMGAPGMAAYGVASPGLYGSSVGMPVSAIIESSRLAGERQLGHNIIGGLENSLGMARGSMQSPVMQDAMYMLANSPYGRTLFGSISDRSQSIAASMGVAFSRPGVINESGGFNMGAVSEYGNQLNDLIYQRYVGEDNYVRAGKAGAYGSQADVGDMINYLTRQGALQGIGGDLMENGKLSSGVNTLLESTDELLGVGKKIWGDQKVQDLLNNVSEVTGLVLNNKGNIDKAKQTLAQLDQIAMSTGQDANYVRGIYSQSMAFGNQLGLDTSVTSAVSMGALSQSNYLSFQNNRSVETYGSLTLLDPSTLAARNISNIAAQMRSDKSFVFNAAQAAMEDGTLSDSAKQILSKGFGNLTTSDFEALESDMRSSGTWDTYKTLYTPEQLAARYAQRDPEGAVKMARDNNNQQFFDHISRAFAGTDVDANVIGGVMTARTTLGPEDQRLVDEYIATGSKEAFNALSPSAKQFVQGLEQSTGGDRERLKSQWGMVTRAVNARTAQVGGPMHEGDVAAMDTKDAAIGASNRGILSWGSDKQLDEIIAQYDLDTDEGQKNFAGTLTKRWDLNEDQVKSVIKTYEEDPKSWKEVLKSRIQDQADAKAEQEKKEGEGSKKVGDQPVLGAASSLNIGSADITIIFDGQSFKLSSILNGETL